MPKWTTVILLAVALIACTSAQPSEDRQTGKGKKPVKATEGNKGNPPAGATPPPLKGNKEPGDARQGPVKVDRSGTKEEKKYVMSSGGFNVETNAAAEKPFFRFWSDVNAMQRVELGRMFQTATPNNITGSRPTKMVNLKGMYTWAFSDASSEVDATTNTTDVQFTMTGTPKETSNANRPAPGLQLVCHLLSSANGTEFMYDVKISDFDDSWWDESATALVLGYRISTMEPDGAKEKGNMSLSDIRIELQADRPVKPKKSDGTNGGTKLRAALDFGNGNGLEIVSTATEDGGAEKVVLLNAMKDKKEGSFVLTIYERFSKGLTHDPTFYTAATSSTLDASASDIVTFGDGVATDVLSAVETAETVVDDAANALNGAASSVAASGICSFVVLSALGIVSSFGN